MRRDAFFSEAAENHPFDGGMAAIRASKDPLIRFVLANEDIHTHVAGSRCVDHIAENIRAAKAGPLPADAVQRILAVTKA